MIGTPVVINGQTVRLRSETVYDGQGRTLQQRTNITQFANGTIDATDVQTTSHEYDSRGNVVKTTFADNTFVAMAYDDRGRKISETNQMGLTRTFAYDSQGRLASVSLPDLDGNSATTNDIATYGYKYDARGNMVQLTDPLGRDTRFTFNNQGQQLTRTLPLGFGADGMLAGTADATADRAAGGRLHGTRSVRHQRPHDPPDVLRRRHHRICLRRCTSRHRSLQ